MSNEINVAFVQQYTTLLELLLQQKPSRFREAVRTSSGTGKRAVAVEQLGVVAAVQRLTRHGDTPLIETPHARRWCTPKVWDVADLIDDPDRRKILIEPNNGYAESQAAALMRAQDDEVINAFFATSVTGEDAAGTETFDTTNFQITTAGGMTVAKLREAKKIFLENEVDIDTDLLFVALKGKQHDDLLGDTQATSLDYTDRPVLVDGRIKRFMGFNFIDSQRLLDNGSSRDRCPAWAMSGMHLKIWKDKEVRITERDDKNYSTQVFSSMMFGATRTEQGKVIDILCTQ